MHETPCNIRNLLTLESICTPMRAAKITLTNTPTVMSSTRVL